MKTRVRAFMPKTPIPLYLKILPLLVVSIIVSGVKLTSCRRFTGEALPLTGECVDITLKKYVGPGDKDGKRCAWRGTNYWCVYNPSDAQWVCDEILIPITPAAPAEK